MRRLVPAIAAAVVGLTALTGCGGSGNGSDNGSASSSDATSSSAAPSASSSHTPEASSRPHTAVITIKGYKYSDPGSVKAGNKVMVKNDDPVAHTVTADTGGGFNVTVAPGKSATFAAPAKPGTYKYHCTYHGNMHGSLKVS